MKNLTLLLLGLGLFLNMGPSPRGNDFFQVITSHPHDLEQLSPHIETVYQNGRLWVVQLKVSAPKNILGHLRPLGGHEKSYLHLGQWISSKSQKMKRDPIKSLVAKVDQEEIRRDVEELASYRTRAAGTADNQLAVKAVAGRFSDMGYQVNEICYRPGACSIIAEKKGLTSGGEVLMIMGHIDSVGEDFAGADDNASGTAVLLEMARVIKDYSNKKTIRFFVTNGEELGLLGAKHYAKHLSDTNKIQELALVINMDMVGYNSNGIVELETNPKYEKLAQWFSDLAARYTTLKTKITLGAWGSDHVPFLEKNVPTLLTIEDWSTKTPCYHLACDTPDTLNYSYAAEIAKLNLSAVLSKDI
jgi:hypothetical protein